MLVAARAYPFLILLITGCAGTPPPASAPSDMLGKPVEMTLPTDSGQLAAIPAPGAKATVADFFAPSCAPCAHKLPALYRRQAELETLGAKLVLIGLLAGRENTQDAQSALSAWGVPGAPFLVDAGDASKREAGVRTLPTTLVLDAHGVVRWAASAESTADDVVAAARAASR
ncbi:MAG TPA: TlpA disulfide reductase family protein [Polyangiaceae bacterium]